jgi:hypothetical protein
MNRRGGERRPPVFDESTAFLRDAIGRPEDGLSGGGAQADDHSWMDLRDLRLEPGSAGLYFSSRGLFVDAPLASFLEFKMLHSVGEIDLLAINACVFKRTIEEYPGWSDEGTAGTILNITRLFPDEDDFCGARTFAEYGLSGMQI